MQKPDWLVEDYDGQMPCLVDSGEAYTDSANIVEYIEYFYPEPTLSMKDNPDAMKKVTQLHVCKRNNVFKAASGAASCV